MRWLVLGLILLNSTIVSAGPSEVRQLQDFYRASSQKFVEYWSDLHSYFANATGDHGDMFFYEAPTTIFSPIASAAIFSASDKLIEERSLAGIDLHADDKFLIWLGSTQAFHALRMSLLAFNPNRERDPNFGLTSRVAATAVFSRYLHEYARTFVTVIRFLVPEHVEKRGYFMKTLFEHFKNPHAEVNSFSVVMPLEDTGGSFTWQEPELHYLDRMTHLAEHGKDANSRYLARLKLAQIIKFQNGQGRESIKGNLTPMWKAIASSKTERWADRALAVYLLANDLADNDTYAFLRDHVDLDFPVSDLTFYSHPENLLGHNLMVETVSRQGKPAVPLMNFPVQSFTELLDVRPDIAITCGRNFALPPPPSDLN